MKTRDGTGIIRHPLALGLAVAGSVSVFILVLAVASFLLRDAPIASAHRRAPAHVPPPATTVTTTAGGATTTTTEPAKDRPAPGSNERHSASTAIAPVFPTCFRAARARDPSLANEVELIVRLDTRASGGTITSLRVGRGGSPFLAACLRQQLVGAGFPAGADGLGEVIWRARLDGDRAVLVEVSD